MAALFDWTQTLFKEYQYRKLKAAHRSRDYPSGKATHKLSYHSRDYILTYPHDADALRDPKTWPEVSAGDAPLQRGYDLDFPSFSFRNFGDKQKDRQLAELVNAYLRQRKQNNAAFTGISLPTLEFRSKSFDISQDQCPIFLPASWDAYYPSGTWKYHPGAHLRGVHYMDCNRFAREVIHELGDVYNCFTGFYYYVLDSPRPTSFAQGFRELREALEQRTNSALLFGTQR